LIKPAKAVCDIPALVFSFTTIDLKVAWNWASRYYLGLGPVDLGPNKYFISAQPKAPARFIDLNSDLAFVCVNRIFLDDVQFLRFSPLYMPTRQAVA